MCLQQLSNAQNYLSNQSEHKEFLRAFKCLPASWHKKSQLLLGHLKA